MKRKISVVGSATASAAPDIARSLIGVGEHQLRIDVKVTYRLVDSA